MKSQFARPRTKTARRSYREHVVEALAMFRDEWQSSTGGQSLVEINSSIGLLLSDIAKCLDLSSQERNIILGKKLVDEIDTEIKRPLSMEIIQ